MALRSLLLGRVTRSYGSRALFTRRSAALYTTASAKQESQATSKPLKLELKENVLIIRFDQPNSKINSVGAPVQKQWTEEVVALLEKDEVKGAVLISSKPDNFIAGADINQIQSINTTEEFVRLTMFAKKHMDIISNFRKPIVCAIDGACLGGGLELAMACHYRIGTSNPKTVLGLPEVMLGIIPGGAGCLRLPKLVGLPTALDMILTGKNIRAEEAKRKGLLHMVVDPKALEANAIQSVHDLAKSWPNSRPQTKLSLIDRAMMNFGPLRQYVLNTARTTVLKKTGGNYPAPLGAIEAIEKGLTDPAAGSLTESTKFGELAMGSVSKALMTIFEAQTSLKQNRFGKPKTQVNTVAVIGAGLMGAGIVEVTIPKNIKVILKDRDLAGLARGEQQIAKNLQEKVKRRRLSQYEADRIMSNVVGLTAADNSAPHLKNVDLVIEAVFEDLKLKQDVLRELEEFLPPHCIFASNTSQLPIAKIAEASKRPQNVVGMHYFSPVDKMPLLEVITTDKTSNEAASVAVDVGMKQGKTVIVVKDGPGFYTTRILAPLMAESACILQDGVSIPQLEKSFRKFGFPVGPIALMDEVGIDVGHHVMHDLQNAFGPRMGGGDSEKFASEMVSLGYKGRKTGKGFYLYDDKPKKGILNSFGPKQSGRPLNPEALSLIERYKKSTRNVDEIEIQHRMVLRLVNEAVLCLQEGILANPTDGDVGAIFGIGFPPFLGGPFRWIDSVGASNIVQWTEVLAQKYGERFVVSPLLKEMAASGKKFFPK